MMKSVRDMAMEGGHSTQMQDVNCVNCHSPFVAAVNSEKKCPKHKRSKSDSFRSGKEYNFESSPNSINLNLDMGKFRSYIGVNKKPLPESDVQRSLQHEILKLEKRLQGQLVVKCCLEKALGGTSSATYCSDNSNMMPKPTRELIREIAVLELEVMHLEHYLLSLYRNAYDQQKCTLSPSATGNKLKGVMNAHTQISQEDQIQEISYKKADSDTRRTQHQLSREWTTNKVNEPCNMKCQEKLAGPAVHRSHSSLSHRAVCSSRLSPSNESLARAIRSCHSQPLSFLEEEENATPGIISLAEYLGANIADLIPETPNKLAEDLVRCMSAIYCKLADPPLVDHVLSCSPASSFSSMSAVSPQYLGDMWSPCYRRESTLDSRLINPFRVEGLKEFSGPYNSMVDIPLISRDPRRLREVECSLQTYRSILHQLETIDTRKMANEEKIAFWINIHNALMMHAHIEYGIPQNSLKKISLLIKATCTIGGRSVNAATIHSSILGCRGHYSGKWLRTMTHPRIKHKAGDEWHTFAIEQREPLVYFALCSGSHSDPAVRIYSPTRLFQQLEAAKEEFIRASVGIWKEQKILLPKLMDLYAKDTRLSSQALLDTVQHYLPETLRSAMQRCQQGKHRKLIDWIPYNFNFRYLLSRELAFPHMI